MRKLKRSAALVLAVLLTAVCALTGCHGSLGMEAFVIPKEFDLSREYEITFWAKNDTNKTQVDIYKQAIADFEALYAAYDLTEGGGATLNATLGSLPEEKREFLLERAAWQADLNGLGEKYGKR